MNIQNRGVGSVLEDDAVARMRTLDIDLYDPEFSATSSRRYKKLKAATFADGGLREPLVVMLRPQATRFITCEGSDMRLRVLKEVRSDTEANDHRFDSVLVLKRPYTSELHLAAMHGRECALRGDYTFFEGCRSLCKQFHLYCRQYGGAAKQTDFIRHMKSEFGVIIEASALSLAIFVMEQLADTVPTFLRSEKTTSKDIRKLRSYIATMRSAWTTHTQSSESEFQMAIGALLQRQDKDHQELATLSLPEHIEPHALEIDYEQLFDDLAHEVAMAVEEDHVTAIVAARWLDAALRKSKSRRRASIRVSPSKRIDENESDLKSTAQLQREASRIAQNLADRYGFGNLMIMTPIACGYLLLDLPDGADKLDKTDEESRRAAAWFAVALGSGILGFPSHVARNYLPTTSGLRAYIEQRSTSLIRKMMIGPDADVIGVMLSKLSNEDFTAFIDLIAIRQTILRPAAGTADLWAIGADQDKLLAR